MRESGCVSIGPNFAKSTFGHGSRSRPPPRLGAAAAGPACITPLTKAVTSSLRMRPLGPLAVTLVRSTPSSRANWRTDGLACALLSNWRSTDWEVRGAGTGAGRGAGACGVGAGGGVGALGAAAGASAAGASAAVVSSSAMTVPSETRSPRPTRSSLTIPACGAGTSIVAFSDSRVTSGASASTASPTLTHSSMTGMREKSPMSGTLTSIVWLMRSLL